MAVSSPPRRRVHVSRDAKWSIAVLIVAILGFYFYNNIVPQLQDNIVAGVQDWAQLSKINECLVYAIMALGLNVVVGYAGLLDLGYVAFWAIGAYTGAWLMSGFLVEWNKHFTFHLGNVSTVDAVPGAHLNFWAVLVVGALVCAIFGILLGAPTLRLRGDYLAIVTLGFGEIAQQFFKNGDSIAGHNITAGTRGINPVDPINTTPLNYLGFPDQLGFAQSSLPFLFLILCGLVGICLFVSLRIRSGRLGRSWLAIREDELAANMMGVPLVRAKLSAYAVGAMFGGLGGVAYSETVGGALPDSFTFAQSIFVLIMVVLGGMGNVWGVLIGALVLDWINNTGLAQLGATINSSFGTNIEISNYNFLVFGVLLVLMMLFRREGFLPESRTKQILREPARTELESVGADVEAGQIDNEPDVDPAADGALQTEADNESDVPARGSQS